MEVHAPRHKDMDPNHPQNLKKMQPKSDDYIPYPPPEGNFFSIFRVNGSETYDSYTSYYDGEGKDYGEDSVRFAEDSGYAS
jgi:hypothetical protein